MHCEFVFNKMPRRKQDCPKRMKWEEEMAALAAAAAATGSSILPQFPHPEEDDKSDEESCKTEDEGELRVDEEEQKSEIAKDEGDCPVASREPQDASQSYGKEGEVHQIETQHIASLFGSMLPPTLPSGFPMDALAQSFLFGAGVPGFLPNNGVFMPTNFPLGIGGLPYGHPLLTAFATHQQQAIQPLAKRTPSPVETKQEIIEKKLESVDHGALDLSTYKRKDALPDKIQEAKIPRLDKTIFPQKNGLKSLISPIAPANVSPADATHALERMSELSRLPNERLTASRQSTWQNHWLSKGGDATRDVLKCVWCKQSFDSLAALTSHMRESKQCGMTAALASQSPSSLSSTSSTTSNKSPRNSINADTAKDGVQLPRKLVRGQDVWLGKGAEQTRQILKCMWCGQSFRSLAEMTSHMQQTQHYTNIISQEQIISWKSTDDKTNALNPVNTVLTCKVCDQAFSSLKELSNHMVKNSHYKEHIMRSLSETGGKRRAARDKRKKALPVRKLLEIERAQSDFHKDSDEKCDEGGREQNEKLLSSVSNISPSNLQDVSRPSSNEGTCASPNSVVDEPPNVLNALEKLIEKSFDSSRRTSSGGSLYTPKKTIIVEQDVSTEFSRPAIDSASFQLPRHRSASESTSFSERSEIKPSSPLIKEEKMDAEEQKSQSPLTDLPTKLENPSPSPSSASDHSASNILPPSPRSESGLSALGSMIDNLKPPGKAHPLAALQKLCDTTENTVQPPRSSGQGGAILAFSWACSDAINNDSVTIKCTFCDTQFACKGTYRHHLSKVHFVKDTGKSANGKASSQSPQPPPIEETPHAKFLKYSELAKQLSSKYA
ncbi:protein tiptop-like [Artemia franciscana]|uniref:C2H2-type domain-containing protein n=1 Tax=Artemia franciscana TaxID=6661 RepID=A0AA88KRU4_ARTSF|nr:hypothetical protein QYM36_017990 [Artemia franciscana]